ncbi:hypothetical protein JQC92_05005 [Shewanella sp. 202IG2-18]|uniref:hypothetical protein n=1 Tax=Parashewanella hymeniacidonis TaxID=2807618 RepID=UPI001960CC47|nr:hypothetical protein [Parashewanella hymeniacidonis]MBM7071399.1 hypothetical protein [Parashewanella hymeniacidonis]
MSSSIKSTETQHTKPVEHDHKKKEVEPQSQHKELFANLLKGRKFEEPKDDNSTKKVSKATKRVLAKDGGTCKMGSAEISRQKDMLCYRLVNGPMAGLIIQANYDKKGLRIRLFPHNSKQEHAIKNVMRPLEDKLQGRAYRIRLECVPPKNTHKSNTQIFMG